MTLRIFADSGAKKLPKKPEKKVDRPARLKVKTPV